MADSSQNGARRRYVRPWEFEVPKELESRTSILESSSFNRRLGGQLNPAQQSPAPMTGRVGVARNRVPARFELLPDPKSRWNRIGLSAVGQLAFLGLLLLSPMIFPQQMQTALRFDVVELMQPVMHI